MRVKVGDVIVHVDPRSLRLQDPAGTASSPRRSTLARLYTTLDVGSPSSRSHIASRHQSSVQQPPAAQGIKVHGLKGRAGVDQQDTYAPLA